MAGRTRHHVWRRGRSQGHRAATAPLAAAGALALAAAVTALSAVPAAAGQAGAGQAGAGQAGAGQAGAPRSDTPSGFWNGTDSSTIAISGAAPYREPVIGGTYGGYIGMAGNWARWAGCGRRVVVFSTQNSAQANADFVDHDGIGTGVYWFMAGPGVDPHYNGTTSEANSWGREQAARTLADIEHTHVTYPVIFMDIEIPGDAPDYTPASDNGWNSVYTSACSGVVRSNFISSSVDRADVNGYAAFITTHSKYKVGVYSAPDIWTSIFGTGSDASIPNTYEWTYESFTGSLAHQPDGWCLTGSAASTCARFFGGVTSGSKYALAWQWSGGGGSDNGVGDFDQIDANRTP
jgi:hypothetical protein